MGRPSKLDDLVAKRIVDATAKGLPRNTVAAIAGIDEATLYRWLERGRNGETGYRELRDRVVKAERDGEERLLTVMESHAQKYWQACAWLLERRNPAAFAKRDTLVHPNADDALDINDESVRESLRKALG